MEKNKLEAQFQLLFGIRQFFTEKKFLEVMPPPMVSNPGMETHIHPFQVATAKNSLLTSWYLNTSPEFHMKELLSLGFKDIFSLGYSFRDEPTAPHHRPQFLMLEWYRVNVDYTQIMDDCEKLFSHCLHYLDNKKFSVDKNLFSIKYEKVTVQDLFYDFLKIDLLDFLEIKDLKNLIEKEFKDIPLPARGEILSWDDYYFLLFLNKIEPHLAHFPYLLIYEFPHHLSALANLKETDQRVAKRFEIYAKGIELCNAFSELCDYKIQRERFLKQAHDKEALYHYTLPSPEVLYNSLQRGLPVSSGIALGVERLLGVLTDLENPFWN